jgi:hypothetical protein
MRWAILKQDGIVVENIIEAEQDFIDQHYPSAVLLNENQNCMTGSIYEGGVFIDPPSFIEELVNEQEVIE